ncbi:MAG: NAD(P)H-binding protein [Terriglobales bacterium]|jgi:putative NADH-flavin reductase
MKVLVLGATGRVGSEAVRMAIAAGHQVTAFVRDPARLSPANGASIAVGDVTRPESLRMALNEVDAVLNAVGVDPLKPSTFVTDSARIIVREMDSAGVHRYVAVSGTASMPKTFIGNVATEVLELTPVRHAIKDHQGAFEIIKASTLDWTLAGCPWIKDGLGTTNYVESDVFPGGMKVIHPRQVADFLTKVLDKPEYFRRIVGIWNV